MSDGETKHDALDLRELDSYEVNPVLVRYLENFRKERSRCAGKVRVLDWGCGRGRTVLKLRQSGYSCFGVDVDPKVLANAKSAFSTAGLDSAAVLKPVAPGGGVDFEEGFFDMIISDQVLEHVADPGVALSEMARVLRPGGRMVHCFPAHRALVECHLKMPLVHWLPKNLSRKSAIAFFLALGVEPRWRELDGAPFRDRLAAYYRYSAEHTFYRSPTAWRRMFGNRGFDVAFVSGDAPALAPIRRVLAPIRATWLAGSLMTQFRMVYMFVNKPDIESPGAPATIHNGTDQ